MEQTIDQALQNSTLILSQTQTESTFLGMQECATFYILLSISLILFITQVKTLVEIVPSLIATIIRWKESLNLEASVKLSRDRNLIAICSILPFCLTVYSFDLYDPAWIRTVGPNARLWIIVGVFGIFFAIRTLLEYMLKPRRLSAKSYNGIVRVAYSFFIILTLALLLLDSTSVLFNVNEEGIRNAMLWISALIYLLYFIRKCQIFLSCCSFFAGFLYLCALEILPTGVLIASAVIF